MDGHVVIADEVVEPLRHWRATLYQHAAEGKLFGRTLNRAWSASSRAIEGPLCQPKATKSAGRRETSKC